jgi:hypothetical protein
LAEDQEVFDQDGLAFRRELESGCIEDEARVVVLGVFAAGLAEIICCSLRHLD